MSLGQAVLLGLVAAVGIEAVTCLLRFGFGLHAERETVWIAQFTFGYRIHHFCLGVLMLIAAALVPSRGWRNLLVVVGIGLVASDMIHHFAVLWPITGSPEFRFRYPGYGG